jgi:DNA repair protein RecN (Recombination protein N)
MLELLSNDKDAVENRLVEAAHLMGKVAVFDNTLGELSGELESTRLTLREVSRRIAERCRSDNQQHERLEKLRERQHTLGALIRRHGGSLQSVLEKAEKLREELSGGTGAESELESITLDLEKLLKRWQKLASEVSEIRKNSAQRLATDVTMALSELGIGKPQFEVDLVRSEDRDGLFETEGKRFKLTERGVEDVEFQFSANPGMPVKPIATVASGGELSRVMLALKEVLPLQSAEASILFDEIDTGVSGRVARLVGYKLRQLSGNRQFLVITHLPQIASLANRHYRVQKLSDLSGTHTLIKELKSEERVDEIALMISGSGLTESARLQARTLLSEAETRI